jgi:hypothetical protein
VNAKSSIWLPVILFVVSVSLAHAQQPRKVPRIGYLSASSASEVSPRADAFRQGLRELGYVEGKNLVIEFRYAEGKFDNLPALAAELVRLKVDVIVSVGPSVTRPAKETTATIPVVMTNDSDPCRERVRHQSSASGWKHYRADRSCPGVKREATGASQGNFSQAFARGRYWNFGYPGKRTGIERHRACRGGHYVYRHSTWTSARQKISSQRSEQPHSGVLMPSQY